MLTTVRKTDGEIKEQVFRELHWDCRTETSRIAVSVADGVVTLSGRVKYYGIKHAAEEAAHRIAGVASVSNSIEVKVPPDEYRGNCEIADAVRLAFEWNVLVPHKRISVLVENGIVSLYGTVDCISQRKEAERAIVNLHAVRGIENHLAVAAQPLQAETICNDISNSLERQAVANAQQVTVNIEGDAVHLSGQVPSWNHRCAVVAAVGFAHGVRRVVDELEIAVSA